MNFNESGARHPQKMPSRKQKRPGEPPPPSAPMYPPFNPYNAAGVPPQHAMYGDQSGPPPPYSATSEYPPPPNSRGYYQPPDQGFSISSQFLNEPLVANVAMQYGQALVGQGREIVDREIEKYVPVSRLKYYFAVDTSYVTKKLLLLFFPFTHSNNEETVPLEVREEEEDESRYPVLLEAEVMDWSVKYEQDEPVQPRYEINSPDLYIPTMAYVTYVLVAGLILGTQNRFNPESLGIQASSALAMTVVEIMVELVTLYITNIKTNLKTLDLLAFGGYKYVGIIFALLLSLLFSKMGYYVGLIYCSISLAFYLVRTLKIQVLPEASQDQYVTGSGNKRRLYLLLLVAGIQPFLMWWLSAHLINPPKT